MRVQPIIVMPHAAGEMHFPNSFERDLRKVILHGLATVARVRKDVVQVKKQTAVGRLNGPSDKLSVGELARARCK